MSLAINIQDLFFSYHDQLILENVIFEVKEGEFIGIFGPNGGGKTTLLKLLMGFLSPASGKIEIFGKPPLLARQQIAYVPQTLRFDRQFPISVLELVLSGCLSKLSWFGRYPRQEIKAAEELIEKLHLSPVKNQAFGTLSGGQAQRALIARALISNPKLLLLDEPTASVDSDAEREIYRILEEIKRQMTILMVTHQLHTAIDQVDRVLLVNKTAVSLKPEEVCEHFAIGLYHPPLIKIKPS